MGAGHSAEGAAYASDPPSHDRRNKHNKRRRHSVDSVASYSSQNHVDRIRTQNFSAGNCQDPGDFGSIKSSLFRRSSSNLEFPHKRPESVTSTSSTRSRLRDFVERKTSSDDHKCVSAAVGDIQYFENPTETLEFDTPRNQQETKKSEERPKKRKLSKSKDKDKDNSENKKKHEKYQSKLAEYYKLPVQLPQDEFYQHLTRSKAAEELLQKRFHNSDAEFNGSYGRLCKHKEPEGSNLRRSRSLAVIREETFTDLQIQNHGKTKRSQLIPRARLFDKPCFKDRLPGRAKYQTKEEVLENIYIDSTASCFGDINAQRINDNRIDNVENKCDKEDSISHHESNHSRSIGGSWPNLNEDHKHNPSEGSIGHSRNPSEIDSLDSNYIRKHYNFESHLNKSYKDSSPDSVRSAISFKENNHLYINTDENDTENEIKDRSKNNTPKSFTNDSLSVTQSEKGKNKDFDHNSDKDIYDEVSIISLDHEHSKKSEPYEKSKPEEYKEDARSEVSENDGTISSPPDSITSYISISIASSTEKSHKLEYLANSLAEKIDEYCEAQYPVKKPTTPSKQVNDYNKEDDPIYTQVNKKRTYIESKRDSGSCKNLKQKDEEVKKRSNSEVYISNTYIENENRGNQRNSSSSKNITAESYVSPLVENQYYSLPDINISKCLRKSERIDAQLREEDPEDIPCENTYEIAHSNFREILSNKGSSNYGQLNQSHANNNNVNNVSVPTLSIYLPEYSEPQIIHDFTKLEDDLKSIITIDSSNPDDNINFYGSDTHQNEREINEIENTIRNTKLITKSESLRLNSCTYKPETSLSKSYSNGHIFKSKQKINAAIKKHYSLRQRDPTDGEIDRLPSPSTVVKNLRKSSNELSSKIPVSVNKSSPLLSRVQSFKTSADSNIALVPLSGHQTIVIDPPLDQNKPLPGKKIYDNKSNLTDHKVTPQHQNTDSNEHKEKVIKFSANKSGIETTTPSLEPFITIKLNKVVKTTIPKLRSDKIASFQYKFEKPPSRFIIKDRKNISDPQLFKKYTAMTRPQVLHVVDSKNKKQNTTEMITPEPINVTQSSSNLTVSTEKDLNESANKPELSAREKLNNAIKTDIEYQEKLHSVKNYWSKLIDKSPDKEKDDTNSKDDSKSDHTIKQDTVSNEENNDPDFSVGNIIKSIESVKIVDSIRKLSQTKIPLWKNESEKVKSDSEIEETTVKKIVKECEEHIHENDKVNNWNSSKKIKDANARDTPEIEIVELSSDDNKNQKTQATLIKAKGFDKGCEDFDHVRYKVMKSELFKNSMIANYKKEAQFDGLLQYLQDYSFQELLVNNNIVIIEPVRTKIEPAPRKTPFSETCKISQSLLKKTDKISTQTEKSKSALRRHFFYHPIRVNKEIIEEELPNPDTVKKVRNLFEDTLKMKSPMTHDPPLVDENNGLTRRATSYRNLNEESKENKNGIRRKIIRQLTIDTNFGNKKWDNASMSSGVSSGDLSSNNEYEGGLSPYSQRNLKENVYSSSDEYLCDSINHDFCCESQYVSPDIMKKIRECGTSVTYYGGKVMNSKPGSTLSPMTKAIMDEIKGLQKDCSRDCYSCQIKCNGEKCACLNGEKHRQVSVESNKQNSSTSPDSGNHEGHQRSEGFPNFKFKLVKSNSCSSRLELTGTDDSKYYRNKYLKSGKLDDPPLVCEEENSVKNKICRLESYNKGIVKTPFENKSDDEFEKSMSTKCNNKSPVQVVRPNIVASKQEPLTENENVDNENNALTDKQAEEQQHCFEKKYYYVNENLHPAKITKGKFGDMVFEEFEVLETCYDSLNSNKAMK